ncbi:MAG: CheB methylesterase domain-containing protein, partial [Pirellulales bacterium]|nr:CheB methylesterase domain-containing protein [Pirellulales bacterium]
MIIGTSTGGPAALTRMLPMLPANLPVPTLIVQHMPPMFTRTLAKDLNQICQLEVAEASGGERLGPGQCYIAPGGKQMKVISAQSGVFLSVTDDPPVNSCRPSVDYLFESVGKVYGSSVLAVVMTGMGDDGTSSLREMRQTGVQVIAQDEASCTVYGMPRCVIEAGLADAICPLDSIAGKIEDANGFFNSPATLLTPDAAALEQDDNPAAGTGSAEGDDEEA